MGSSPALREVYLRLLQRRGLESLLTAIPASEVQKAFAEGFKAAGLGEPKDARLFQPYKDAVNPMQAILESTTMELEDAVATLGRSLPIDIFVGIYPTGSVNAQARREETGVLVLVNRGLMSLIYMTLKLNILSARVGDESGPLTGDVLPYAVADVAYAYIFEDDPAKATQFPVPPLNRSRILGVLVRQCEKFVVAHEFGHALASHLTSGSLSFKDTPGGDLKLVEKSWEQEYEADRIGLDLMLAGYDPSRDRDPRHFDVASRVAGATFLLTLDFLVGVIRDSLSGLDHPPVLTDHPPARERVAALLKDASGRQLPAGSLDLSEALNLWLGNMVDEVAALVRSKAAAQRRA